MPLNVYQQEELSKAPPFLARIRVLLCQKAKAVSVAPLGGVITPESKALATRVQSDPVGMAAKIAVSFVSDNAIKGNNFLGSTSAPNWDTDRTDAQLESAIGTAWDAGSWNGIQ